MRTRRRRTCLCERDALAVFASQGEKLRSCRDNQLSEWGGTCARETTRVCIPVRTREGLSGPATSAQHRRPPERRARGGILPHADLTSALGSWGGKSWDVRVSGGPRSACHRLPSGRAAFQKLVLSWLLFRKFLNRFFQLFYPRLFHNTLLSCGVSS